MFQKNTLETCLQEEIPKVVQDYPKDTSVLIWIESSILVSYGKNKTVGGDFCRLSRMGNILLT